MTLHYEFPCIAYWHTVAKHFEGNENFVIVDKEDYFVVNYIRAGKETHPPVDADEYRRATTLREARGLIFCSKTGVLLSRPFHKFFNLGEREDIVPDFSKPHHIIEKLDGSMIRPIPLPSGIRWGTKMGVTDVAMQAEEFVAKNMRYHAFADACIGADITPIFEWISRQQRIVLDYPEDNLILLAMRNNFDGTYISRQGLEAVAKLWHIPLVKVHSLCWSKDDPEEFKNFIRSMTGIEGFVIQFDDGHMVKMKTDEYVALHRAKSLLENEREVIGLILEEKTDDLLPLLPESDRARLVQFEEDLWYDILTFQSTVNAVLRQVDGLPRKEFALSSESMETMLRAAVFKHYDLGYCELKYILDTIQKHLGSNSSFAKIKGILKAASWKEIKTDE